MSKVTTISDMENRDKNNFSNTNLFSGDGELNRPEDLTACPSCGSQNLSDSNFCIVCGRRLSRSSSGAAEFDPFGAFPSGRESVNMFKTGNTCLLSEIPSDSKDAVPKKGLTDTARTESAEKGGKDERTPVPILTRTKNGERIIIEKPVFKIGTSRESCDMVITDNRYISRIHAYIITRDGRCFIMDRNSTNKTYVNGKEIPAETETELFNNTTVRLANEDMVFGIEYVSRKI